MILSQEIEQRYDRIAAWYDSVNFFIPNRWRRKAIVLASGHVLEVGVGTGLNFPYYTTACSEIYGIDLSKQMLGKAAGRAPSIKIPIILETMDVQNLQLAEKSFDSVVATFVFCTVPDPAAGLAECARVLKPGGSLILLEHVGSRHYRLGKMMQYLNPAAVRFMGDHITRDTAAEVVQAGFTLRLVENLFLDVVKIIVGIK